MELKERIYFEKKRNYSPRTSSKYPKTQDYVTTLAKKVRETADYTLSGEISPKQGKKEISTLIQIINKLKEEVK